MGDRDLKEAQSRIWGLKLVLANKTSVRSPEWTSHYPSLIFFSIFLNQPGVLWALESMFCYEMGLSTCIFGVTERGIQVPRHHGAYSVKWTRGLDISYQYEIVTYK